MVKKKITGVFTTLDTEGNEVEMYPDNLVASDNTLFRFGVNENGEYGYIVTDSAGADTVIPFKSGGGDAATLYQALQYSGLVTSDMTFDEMCTVLSNVYPPIPTGTVYEFNYNGSVQLLRVEATGYYQLEVYGGQGGSNYGGKGGYAKGKVYLNINEDIYICVGGNSSTGYNGGGIASGHNGGGATHIAKVTGTLAQIGYTSAVTNGNLFIVAGGGGAGEHYTGGSGGGTNGGNGTGSSGSGGGGGSQTGGYAFGRGENGSLSDGGRQNSGGGGFYGGRAGGSVGSANVVSGGGGSGYTGGCISGTTSMTNGTRSGNGYAKITFLGYSL